MKPDDLLARLRSAGGTFTSTQLATLGAVLVVVSGLIVFSTRYIEKPSYTVLYSRMEPEAASQVVAKLKQMKVSYELDDGGGTIRVPASKVDELRLELSGQGLLTSGRIGFEIFDKTAFGATEFMEKVNYRRALEGEIARTIATISEVASARVHIAMGKDSTFGESRPTKASVVLKLRGQASLPASAIAGISGLVAASVEGLRPESVVILDSFGRPLSRSLGDDSLGGPAQLERQQRLEHDLSQRVVQLLEPVVGPERVRVNVALKLNPQTREETEERWDPNSVVRSRQLSSDAVAGGGATATGGIVAGARGNVPPPATPNAPLPGQAPVQAAAAPAGAGQAGRMAENTSYEVSRTMRHVSQPPGEVARMSVAVILDDAVVVKKNQDGSTSSTRTPRSREELQKMQALVAAAVGLDQSRGDQITVEQMSFDEPPAEEIKAPSIVDRIAPRVTEWSRLGVVAAIAIFAILVVVRPLMRRATPMAAAVPAPELMAPAAAMPDTAALPAPAGVLAAKAPTARTPEELEAEIENQLNAEASDLGVDAFRVPVLTRRIASMASKEPENVARLLRTWMRERGERA